MLFSSQFSLEEKMEMKCFAVTFGRIKMTVGSVGRPDRDGLVIITEERPGNFELIVPEQFTYLLSPGDVIYALCVPDTDLITGLETVVLAKQDIDGSLVSLHKVSDYWADQFNRFKPNLL